MDFSLSVEQRELTEAAAAFARRELGQDLLKREDAGEFPREAWRGCARFGVQGLPVPAELGGAGADIVTTALVMEALGYGCQDNGLLFPQRADVEHRAAAGDVRHPRAAARVPARNGVGDLIGAHAMTEPGSGSDALHMRTRAERRGTTTSSRGPSSHHQPPLADVLLVYARTRVGPDWPGSPPFSSMRRRQVSR